MCCWKLRGTWSWIMWLFPAVWSFAPCRLHLTICGSRFSRQSFKPNPEGLSLRIYIVRAPRFWSIYFVAVHGRLYVPFSRENIENILFVLAKKFKRLVESVWWKNWMYYIIYDTYYIFANLSVITYIEYFDRRFLSIFKKIFNWNLI